MFSKTAHDAIRAVVHLAGQQQLVSSTALATVAAAPKAGLRKSLTKLVKAGILAAHRSPTRGGFQLVKPAGKVSLADVVEAVDGPFGGAVPKVGRLDGKIQAVADDCAGKVRGLLGKVTLAELV